MSKTHKLIILPPNSVPRRSSIFSCDVFVPLVDWGNQRKVIADALVSDSGRRYHESVPTNLTGLVFKKLPIGDDDGDIDLLLH